ncbi:Mg-protoporphyrin IX methyltransferase [Rhodobacter aestuarii]|uniref:Magnesium protoporphyrin IX methyltransferase n=1 Tax=Rhodobacter aestuarii TaxID=453582 RepID=A0A1N7MLQ7_9RHOB|nr:MULTISPECIES: magnesium protoporphyrin IX methyltransferase [Rhodobacter]PTV96678.1 Mg-protoporphyrin IX methyltransferase [Rhodobacter aestuarii]SIS86928.1 Mg-protoporphyrin IX methyltransferase [Rhodobacter aestuarii]SOB90856.1 Mg-protoporphyrin IX methyltransferase [Rhodobacter sp. JA431]
MANDYAAIRDRVEHYFDRTATRAWERLTQSDAKVSKVRQTVREGRDKMRAIMLSRLPEDLTGCRVLDAGCGTGLMTAELAKRGAEVLAVDISPQLISVAQDRLPVDLREKVTFMSGDMTDPALGQFDYVIAMDSLIYYRAHDIGEILTNLGARTHSAIVFTVAPKTPFLMAFWGVGKLFPRSNRSPVMIPHALEKLQKHVGGWLLRIDRVAVGFYISECLEYRP